MVAKGLIAKTVEHLWDTDKRIDVVYICSNSQIARQNLSRLNVVGGSELKHADRLTLLPKVIRNLRDQRINFVSFTPGTSFQVGQLRRRRPERVLLYWMLAKIWGSVDHWTASVEEVLRRWQSRRTNFENELGWFDRSSTRRRDCARRSATRSTAAIGPDGRTARARNSRTARQEFSYLRGKPQR